MKKRLQSGKPQQYSADKPPHTREVASCPAGGRQACIGLEPAGSSTRPARPALLAHVSFVVCGLWVAHPYMIQQYYKKKLKQIRDMVSARIEHTPSSPKSGIVTISLY